MRMAAIFYGRRRVPATGAFDGRSCNTGVAPAGVPLGAQSFSEADMVHTLAIRRPIVAAGWVRRGPRRPPVYDATFSVTTDNGTQSYTGTTTFVVDAKGGVTGKMNLTQPTAVEGTLSGTIKAGTWTFEYPYSIARAETAPAR